MYCSKKLPDIYSAQEYRKDGEKVFDSTLVTLSKEKMKYTSARHGVIASNIANANTPMAKSKDLMPFSDYFLRNIMVHTSKTSPAHITSHGAINNYKVTYSTDGTEEKLNQNNINLDTESTKLAINALEYRTALSLYSKTTRMFSSILDQR